MSAGAGAEPIWVPSTDRVARSTLRAFLDWLERREGRGFPDHPSFWEWSVADIPRFWSAMWDYVDIASTVPPGEILVGEGMPDVRWFPGTRLNYAQHCLRPGAENDVALICVSERDGVARTITRGALRRDVAALAGWLRRANVRPGDRVAGYLPNTEHAIVACLAAASIGAVWAVCSPDFGADGTVARLAQLEPTILFAVDGYHWNGRRIDRRDVAARLATELPSVREVVFVPYAFESAVDATAHLWADVLTEHAEADFEQVEFSEPLWVLFSSGTTGAPKGLVHSHGGITLEHLTWNTLYAGLEPGDRMFVYTSTTWMLWNLLLSGLAFGATPVLYEGSPGQPNAGIVWEIAARTRSRLVLLGAALVTAAQNAGISPRERYNLSALDTVMVSGSALPGEGYAFVRDHIGAHVRLDSTSGGTDICGPFVGGNELSPVWPGEIAGPLAGVAVAAWDDDGKPVVGAVGELVVTAPMPSMPVALWNDPDGARYRETYFDTWPGTWRHGDWVTLTARGTVIVHGRSDATLNRDGVRMGSSDFYDVVDSLPGIAESLVVGVDEPGGGYYLPLFVVPAPGIEIDDEMRHMIRRELRTRRSPRHVPDEIVAVPAVPHTLTGKRLEVPVKKLLAGVPLERAVNLAAVDDPEVLRWYDRFAQTRRAGRTP